MIEDARFRYTYTATGQLATVSTPAGQPVATYRYNSRGQRVAKTVGTMTTYTLWQDGQRVAEIDAAGKITAQTLYLAEGQRAAPIARLDGEQWYAIHTDPRGAPIAMTDAQKAVVWRASVSAWGGSATPADGKSFGPASLNLRLPGQFYDEETGLHDNGFRTYDPLSGNYLQPDPLGYPDGPNPYRYAQGDPVNRIDPTGLYAADVHYYMTYFLALTAGLSENDAWIIATADQTVDNVNPYTDALPHLDPWDADSAKARELYHFTQTSTDWDPLNTQTKILLDYYKNASAPCLKRQFYGEFLHAYEDTFGHRDWNNVPYDTDGHGNDLTSPDKTYNHDVLYVYHWTVNEDRTLLMEQYVFNQIREDWHTVAKDTNGINISASRLESFLKEWNKIEEDGELAPTSQKLRMLNEKLTEFGLPTIPPYIAEVGLGCRLKYLGDANLIGADGKATTDAKTKYPAPSWTPKKTEL